MRGGETVEEGWGGSRYIIRISLFTVFAHNLVSNDYLVACLFICLFVSFSVCLSVCFLTNKFLIKMSV